MSARVFIGSKRVDAVPADDRGLAYGDGLFETLRVHRGTLPWWDAHWARLAHGAERLRLLLPNQKQVRDEADALFTDGADGVLKLLVTRGSGGRGYAPPSAQTPTWVLSRHPLPPAPAHAGLQVRWCETRMAWQPLLAGLKHCNRLEQVLARAECQVTGMDEGVLCDHDGNVVGATSANLFVLHEGRWLTPLLDRCGVAGICRAQLLAPLGASETRLDRALVETAEAVFLCNAVRGILPVVALDARRWPPHPGIEAACRVLTQLHPAFALKPPQDIESS